MRKGLNYKLALGAAWAMVGGFAVAAQAQVPVTLFTTQDDFTGWTNGSGSPVTSFGPSSTDYDGSSVNGLGNTTLPVGIGTPGSMEINTGSNAIGYTFTVFSPSEQNNQAFMTAFDPGSVAGSSTVTTTAYSGTLYYTYSVPNFTGPDDYYQVGVDIAYAGDSYYGQFFESSLSAPVTVGGIQWVTATIPYTIVASSGGGFSISPSFNAGVYGSGVSGVDNVINGPVYFDDFQVNTVPEPMSLGLLSLGGLLSLRRRRA